MTGRDFYQVLGVAREATPTEIRVAYARLVKRHHPDRAGQLPARLHDIQQAYRCLSDPTTRADHDLALAKDERAHLARQRTVRRRLGRYDGRHPQAPPRSPRKRCWTRLAVAAVGLLLVAQLSWRLFG